MNHNEDIIKGKDCFSKGHYSSALECFKKVIQSNPDSKEAYLLEAMSYQHLEGEKSKNALSALYRILVIDPEDSIVPNYIDMVSSGKLLSQIIELYPVCYEISLNNARYYVGENEFIVNFIDDVTMKFRIIDDNNVGIVFCIYDKHCLGRNVDRGEMIEEKIVVIPPVINYCSKEYTVLEIGERSFDGLDSNSFPSLYLSKIVIPNTVKRIKHGAFGNCSYLKSILIPKSVVDIEPGAFSYCTKLERIDVEDGNSRYDSRDKCNAIIETKTNKVIVGCKTTKIPQTVSIIGYAAFHGQRTMKSIIIPDSITSIEQSAFLDTGLERVQLPNSLFSIGKLAFGHCFLQSVSFGKSLTIIGESAFSNNPKLNSIVIPKSVKEIGLRAFCSSRWGNGIQSIKVVDDNLYYDSRNNCNAIVETRTDTLVFGCRTSSIPETIKHIGENAFYECDSLMEVSLPNSIETIGIGAFCCCVNLCNIVLPESITRIELAAFAGCEKLTDIVIPQNVSYIGERVFSGCKNMKKITCLNPRPPYLQSDVLFSSLYESKMGFNVVLRVPSSSVEDYKNTPGWKLFKNILAIEDSVKE